ncbi:hypothetical protein [Nocardia fluminea]|uniref:hypothetical protein n=1 Tax=Nocardia fluminea TaxID=134984 RepID=UPI00364D838F
MSNGWDLRCRTCNDTLDLGWNHDPEMVQQLIPHLPAYAALVPVIKSEMWRLDLTNNAFQTQGIAYWAAEHHTHELIAVDEYGHLADECGAHMFCQGGCKNTTHCRLAPGHDGDHSPHRPTEITGA